MTTFYCEDTIFFYKMKDIKNAKLSIIFLIFISELECTHDLKTLILYNVPTSAKGNNSEFYNEINKRDIKNENNCRVEL